MGHLGRATLAALLVVGASALVVPPAQAHSYADPALTTVLDRVEPALPAGVGATVVPSVVDELVLTNTTPQPFAVLATTGEPVFEVSSKGVLANLASPSWYLTGTPDGGAPVPGDVQRANGKGAPRLALVDRGTSWSEFDARLHPAAVVPAQARAEKRPAVIGGWTIPLRYAGRTYTASGHVQFTPVRGGLSVAVSTSPAGAVATPVQGELPGLFLRPPTGRTVVVDGRAGEPFLRFDSRGVAANTASPSWVDDQRARGNSVAPSGGPVHWVPVTTSPTYSWLDPRLRYPADQPAEQVLDRPIPTVVEHWSVPVTVDGAPSAIAGTVTWVPRALAVAQLTGARSGDGSSHAVALVVGGSPAVLLLAAAGLLLRRRRSRHPIG